MFSQDMAAMVLNKQWLKETEQGIHQYQGLCAADPAP
jgi:hypothetical protein